MRLAEIKGTNLELTDPIKDYVEKKLQPVAKLADKFEPCDVRVDVGRTQTNQQKGNIFRAEFNLTLPGVLLRAEATENDLYAAIDVASSELRGQVKKYKEKLRDADRVKIETTIEEHAEEIEI